MPPIIFINSSKAILVTGDVARLLPTKVKEIKHGTTEKQLKDWVKTASQHHEKIAIAGMQHSQGGQMYYPNAILLDMKQYNKIIDYKPRQKNYGSKRDNVE